ncbi:MAG: T9SS type A sorting domain-containing protein [Bacteroidia bacterium]
MKKIFFYIFIAINVSGFSQVVLTQKDSLRIGSDIIFDDISDTLILYNFKFAKTGTNNFWDFSKMISNQKDTAHIIDPKQTYYKDNFKDCNIAFGERDGFGSISYYKTDSSGNYHVGFAGYLGPSHFFQTIRFEHPFPDFKFPVAYPYINIDSNHMRTKNFFHHSGDSGYNEQYLFSKREVVATGLIKLSFGTFETFLMKFDYSFYDTTWYIDPSGKKSFEINGNPRKYVSFEWYCNNSLFYVAQVYFWVENPNGIDEIGGILVQMNNYANLKSVSVDDIEPTKINIYPNPASSKLFIENLNLKNSSYVITDISGREIKKDNLQTEINIEDLQQGMYIISLYNKKELLGRKKFVKD